MRPRRDIGLWEGRGVVGSVAVFAATGLAAVLVIAAATVLVARRSATHAAVSDARDVTTTDARTVIQPTLRDSLWTADPAAIAALDDIVRARVLSARVVRVKLWTSEGRILYSDEPSLIGRTFDIGADEQRAIATGTTHAEVSDLARPENLYERQFHKLLEVYDGIRTPNGQPVLYEEYLRFSTIDADINRTFGAMAPALVAGLLLLFVIQIPLAWSLARRVERGQEEERRLLARAVESSEVERRHLAADLHDGVIQSLVGVSLSLTAIADHTRSDGDAELAARIASNSHELRQSVRDLRSLILSIAPPRLHEEGLSAAVDDLMAPIRTRGLEVDLTVTEPLVIPEWVESLIYRTAQEAVRNITTYARATRVDVAIGLDGPNLRLSVKDDGVGFDPSQLPARQGAGHVGLRLLAELAHEAGGHLDVTSEPGRGTTLTLEVPVS